MLGIGLAVRCLFFGAMPLAFLAYHIPGFFASLYWAHDSKLVRIIPVLFCTVLFLMHPVGAQSFWYSLFWLIPVITSFYSGLFYTALGSSFTAHAMGTVVWLYAGQLQATDFAILVPVVIVERLMIAVTMVIAYKGIAAIFSPSVRLDRGSIGAEWRVLHSLCSIDPNGFGKKPIVVPQTFCTSAQK